MNLPKNGKLQTVDIHHHFASPAKVKELKEALPCSLIAGKAKEPHQWDDEIHRYTAVSE